VSAMTTMCIDYVYQIIQSYERILTLEEEKFIFVVTVTN